MELISYSNSYLSLLAPTVAITLAIMTRRVILSLGAGIVTGVLLLTSFSPLKTFAYLSDSFTKVFWNDGLNTGSVFILLFLLLLGIITTLIDISGGARAFGDWARKHVKTRQGAQLLTVLLGLIIFIDDYFNALAVGNIGRPLTDRQGVSRAKLAYLIDSTAAPMCVITPISSWGAYIIALISSILLAHGITDVTAIMAFVNMVPMNLYAVFALAMVICTAYLDLNVGPMLVHERRARAGELYDSRKGTPPGSVVNLAVSDKGSVADLIIPISTLVVATSASLIATGAVALQEAEKVFSVLGAFENTNVVNSLLYGGLIALVVTAVRMISHGLDASRWLSAITEGVRSMLPAIYILVFAWVLVDVIGSLETGKYLAGLVVSSNIDSNYLPMIMFVVAGLMAFATGTSWGTFGIMLPIAGDMAAAADVTMMLPVLASVLAGSVFGDHSSPISDTTILSSTGASCHHIDHVTTQIPYALSIAVISILGYFVMGMTDSVMTGFMASLLAFVVLVIIFRKCSGVSSSTVDNSLVEQ